MIDLILATQSSGDLADVDAVRTCESQTYDAMAVAAQAASPDEEIIFLAHPRCPRTDVIVVVGRTWQRTASVPATVSVIDAETIRTQALSGLGGALALIPGVQSVPTGPLGSQASVFVRGTDSDHVLTTYDGIRLNSPATPNGAYSFGSDLLTEGVAIEVLRGPASATYGSDAIGGVINVVPSASAGGAVSLSVGELDTLTGSAHAAGEAGPVRYTLGGAYRRTDGWDAVPGRIRSRAETSERDGGEGFSLNADLDVAISADLTVSLTGLHRQAEAEFDTFSGGPKGLQRANADLRSEDRLTVARVGAAYAVRPGLSVTANAGLVDADFEETDGDEVTGDVRGDRVFGELLGRYDSGGTILSVGAILEREDADIPISFGAALEARETHGGAFVFAAHEATEALTLTGAVRIDGYDGFGTPVTWNAGAAWREGRLRLRANAGTAFNAPSLSERFARSAFNVGNPDLGEETAFAVEAGAAYTFGVLSGSLTTEAVLFRTDTDDLIEYDFSALANRNVGDARAQGAELSARFEGGSVSAYLAYTYTDAENRDTGEPLLRRPEHGITARAAWQASDKLTLSARWIATGERPDVTYSGDGFFQGTGRVDGFDEVAATALYGLTDGLSVFATAANLLGETYEQPAGFGSPPRRFRAGVRYGW